MNSPTETFEQHRGLLFGIAYRMLGSAMEAEDMVQETYLRYQSVAQEAIESPRAFLSTVVTRLCLDQLKSAQSKREDYYGTWLPEPIPTDGGKSPAQVMGDLESLSFAIMVLLEKLSPVERAVFLLREVFDYDYAEISGIVQKEEATCRQILSRAKRHIHANRPRFESSREEHDQIFGQFVQAIQVGDLSGLMNLLSDDVASWSDGGGKRTAATRVIEGAERVAKFFVGLAHRGEGSYYIEIREINGRSAVLIYGNDGTLFSVINFDISGGKIHAIRSVLNPDKLKAIEETP
ncbi:MAG: RNA polymerase sigma-70 factor [Aggregatilineales bacterium]